MEEKQELEGKVQQGEITASENEEGSPEIPVSEKNKADFRILDFKISPTGKFCVFKISSHTDAGDEYNQLLVLNIHTGKTVYDYREASVTHFEWHPVYNKLLYVGVLSGLNAVDINEDGSRNLLEGVVKHSVLFLEYFHFSPKGKSAGYLLRDISVIPASAELEEKNIRDILLDEEKAQLLFYEKAEISERIEGLGRSWNWLDDDQLIYNYQDEIFIKDVVWGTKKGVGRHEEFVMDFIPSRKKVVIISVDYKNLLTRDGNFNVFILDIEKEKITPVDIGGDFIPEMVPMGSLLIFNRKRENSFVISSFDLDDNIEKSLTPEDHICKFPKIWKNNIYYLHYSGDDIELCSMNPMGEDVKTILKLNDFLEKE